MKWKKWGPRTRKGEGGQGGAERPSPGQRLERTDPSVLSFSFAGPRRQGNAKGTGAIPTAGCSSPPGAGPGRGGERRQQEKDEQAARRRAGQGAGGRRAGGAAAGVAGGSREAAAR